MRAKVPPIVLHWLPFGVSYSGVFISHMGFGMMAIAGVLKILLAIQADVRSLSTRGASVATVGAKPGHDAGVDRPTRWKCPECGSMNEPTTFRCAACSFQLT